MNSQHQNFSSVPIKDQIMDVAQRLVQTRGYNDFSYADISSHIGIRKASIHYYFPNKTDLGTALVARYCENFLSKLAQIDQKTDCSWHKLEYYADLYADVLRDDRMCLCGMLATEIETLPVEMHEELKVFFAANETWLVEVLNHGIKTGTLYFKGSVEDAARFLIAGLEGAMLMARFSGKIKQFQPMSQRLLASFLQELQEEPNILKNLHS